MKPILNPKNVAGRAAICRALAEVAEMHGASVRVIEHWRDKPSRESRVRIAYGPAEVGIAVGPAEARYGFCLPWHMNYITDPDARYTPAFSAAAGAPVNPFHRRKCTTFYPSLETTLDGLGRVLQCLADGTGIEHKESQ